MLHELEDAAAVPAEDESDDDEEEGEQEDEDLDETGDVTARLSNVTHANDPDRTICTNRSSSPLSKHKTTRSSRPESGISQEDGSEISKKSQVRSPQYGVQYFLS